MWKILLGFSIIYMWKMLLAFSIGVYVGTYYNCKPILEHMIETAKKKLFKGTNEKIQKKKI